MDTEPGRYRERIRRIADKSLFYLCMLSFGVIIWDSGFYQDYAKASHLNSFYIFTLLSILVLHGLQINWQNVRGHFRRLPVFVDLTLFLLFIFLAVSLFINGPDHDQNNSWIFGGILIFCIVEFLKKSTSLEKIHLSPSSLFAGSFALVILAGAAFLMLPRSTVDGIRFIDALFTSASAVCVTGLTVVDTSTYFTRFGQNVILSLIEIGGLGVMTFTGLIGFFLKGSSSIENRLILKEMVNADAMSKVYSILGKIIFVTFTVEAVGAVLMYFYLPDDLFPNEYERWYFAIFHSVSAFCNAGFSTFTNGLFEEGIRFNYPVQLIISFLVIIGGLGFVIAFDFYRFLKYSVKGRFKQLVYGNAFSHPPRTVNLHTNLAVYTTVFLLGMGTVFFYLLEQDNVLKEHSLWGKMVGSFFGAVTPRSAGFNAFDMTILSLPTILFIILLMYIGASPGSTGGGIKTTVFAVGILNIFSTARGKKSVEIKGREISYLSVRKSYSVIAISLIAIGLFTFLISIAEPDKDLKSLAFESFSAYGTVGLSLGITPNLSEAGKIIIIITMFTGRVGLFTILIGLLPKPKSKKIQMPVEEVIVV